MLAGTTGGLHVLMLVLVLVLVLSVSQTAIRRTQDLSTQQLL